MPIEQRIGHGTPPAGADRSLVTDSIWIVEETVFFKSKDEARTKPMFTPASFDDDDDDDACSSPWSRSQVRDV